MDFSSITPGPAGQGGGQPSAGQSGGGGGPVGQGDYVVKRGDCILSIAADSGHFWETIWNDAPNAELRDKRGEPQKVLPGDRLTVMPVREKQEPCAPEKRHRFKRKGVPAQLRLRFMIEEPEDDEDTQEDAAAPDPDALHTSVEDPDPPKPPEPKPRADVPYVLVIDGEITEGTTDKNGEVEIPLPPNARRGELTLEPGTPKETKVPLMLGHLDPVTEDSGVVQRLCNLGYPASEEPEAMASAIEAFQAANGMEATGELDDQTRSKIKDAHGE